MTGTEQMKEQSNNNINRRKRRCCGSQATNQECVLTKLKKSYSCCEEDEDIQSPDRGATGLSSPKNLADWYSPEKNRNPPIHHRRALNLSTVGVQSSNAGSTACLPSSHTISAASGIFNSLTLAGIRTSPARCFRALALFPTTGSKCLRNMNECFLYGEKFQGLNKTFFSKSQRSATPVIPSQLFQTRDAVGPSYSGEIWPRMDDVQFDVLTWRIKPVYNFKRTKL